MPFPTIPTVAAGRVLSVLATSPAGTHTSPNLSSLTKNAGDLLIAIVVTYDGNSTDAEFSSWGGGFTEFFDSATATTMGIGCAYKWSTGAETGTFTVTSADTSTNDSAFFLLSIPGAHNSTPPEAGSRADGTTAAADPAAFDPAAWDVEETLWIAVGGSGETGTGGAYTGIAAGPAGYTNYVDSGMSADAIGAVEAAVAFRQAITASEDVGTFDVDLSNARNAAAVIAVRSPVVTYIRPRGSSFPPGRKMPRIRPEAQHPAYPTATIQTLEVAVSGLGAVTANFVREQRVLAASIAGTGSVSPNFVRDKRVLAASIAGTGTVTAANSVTRSIAVVIAGTGSVVAEFVRIKLMAVNISGVGTLTANFVRDKRALNAVIAGTGAVSANFVRNLVLQTAITGVGTLSATLAVTRSLAAAIAGVGTVSANFVRQNRVLNVAISGLGTVAADLSVTGGAIVRRVRTLLGIGN